MIETDRATPARTAEEAGRSRHSVRWPRIVGLGAAALFTGRYVRDPATWSLLDDVNLAIHEAGHVLFSPFGEFLMMLGGSLLQLLVPAAFVAYFARSRQWFAAGIVTFWFVVSLINVGTYVGDARARELPLITGDPTTHDWTWLLIRMDLLEHDRRIMDFAYRLATVLYLGALGLAGYHALWAGSRGDADGAGRDASVARPSRERADRSTS
jgi:hypothetical protein